MDREKERKRFKVFIIVALSSSLIMNFMLLSKVNWLDNQLNQISSEQQNLHSTIDWQTSEIEHVLNKFKEEQSWLGPIHYEVNSKAVEEGQVEVLFKWQVKEWQQGSQVFFNYARGDQDEYVILPAKEIQQGLFQMEIPVEVDVQPSWEVTMRESRSNIEEMSQTEVGEKLGQSSLKYFVSVVFEDVIKSGEIQMESFAYYGTDVYGMIQADVHRDKKNTSVTVMHHQASDKTKVIEEAYLLKYDNELIIDEEQIELENQHGQMRIFHLNQVNRSEANRFAIKVVYRDGSIFEKEIF
ncbi:hypothetical protein [Bacillus sp. B15-48]|uniref:hypothetical protein n=1 Tax=Bacillus sp. B15-48 TaxID=1548601 RepID=UPI00193F6898|nr:hypothetical protein [Bacillus sp. B15-48]MBM4761769.1 hypothetical protein [Bacillus sp. B15-48]